MEVNIKENTLTYSKSVSSGAYFSHLTSMMGAKTIPLPEDLKELTAQLN